MDTIPILTDELTPEEEIASRKHYEIDGFDEFVILALFGVLGLVVGAVVVCMLR